MQKTSFGCSFFYFQFILLFIHLKRSIDEWKSSSANFREFSWIVFFFRSRIFASFSFAHETKNCSAYIKAQLPRVFPRGRKQKAHRRQTYRKLNGNQVKYSHTKWPNSMARNSMDSPCKMTLSFPPRPRTLNLR